MDLSKWIHSDDCYCGVEDLMSNEQAAKFVEKMKKASIHVPEKMIYSQPMSESQIPIAMENGDAELADLERMPHADELKAGEPLPPYTVRTIFPHQGSPESTDYHMRDAEMPWPPKLVKLRGPPRRMKKQAEVMDLTSHGTSSSSASSSSVSQAAIKRNGYQPDVMAKLKKNRQATRTIT